VSPFDLATNNRLTTTLFDKRWTKKWNSDIVDLDEVLKCYLLRHCYLHRFRSSSKKLKIVQNLYLSQLKLAILTSVQTEPIIITDPHISIGQKHLCLNPI
jgi:hypothetical protein